MRTRRTVAVFMGTRPEAIKMAPVVAALRRFPDLDGRVVATGQHREMFQQVADQFGFEVNADLGVMRPGQTLAALTARLMDAIDGWLEHSRPDMALVQGRADDVQTLARIPFPIIVRIELIGVGDGWTVVPAVRDCVVVLIGRDASSQDFSGCK